MYTKETHMLNPFPILFLAPLAYALVRVTVGILCVRLGITHLRHRADLAPVFRLRIFPFPTFIVWYLGLFELIIGLALFLGFLTQIAALLLFILSLKFIVMHRRWKHPLIPSRVFFVLLAAVSLSLCMTGAGVFAFDLPI